MDQTSTETNQLLTTDEVLMALEEMPPGTGYAALVGVDGRLIEMALIVRGSPNTYNAYWLATAQCDDYDCSPFFDMLIGYADRVSFAQAIRRAPLIHAPCAWMRDGGTGERLLKTLRNVIQGPSDA